MPTQRVAAPGVSKGMASGWAGPILALAGHARGLSGFPLAPLGGWQARFTPRGHPCGAESAPLAVYGARLSVPCRFPRAGRGEVISRRSKGARDNLQAPAGQSCC